MAGFPELLVGYRARDPRAVYADYLGGRCVSCGNTVYFNASAEPILAGDDHDPTIVCDWCYRIERSSIDQAMV